MTDSSRLRGTFMACGGMHKILSLMFQSRPKAAR